MYDATGALKIKTLGGASGVNSKFLVHSFIGLQRRTRFNRDVVLKGMKANKKITPLVHSNPLKLTEITAKINLQHRSTE